MGHKDLISDPGILSDLNGKRSFIDGLLMAFKRKNQNESIGPIQYFHLQQRLSAWVVTVPMGIGSINPAWAVHAGQTFTFNLMNSYPTGDIEAACYALMWGTPDDMTQPEHFLSAERLTWLVDEIKTELGW